MFHACNARFDVLGTKQGLMSKPTFFIKKKLETTKPRLSTSRHSVEHLASTAGHRIPSANRLIRSASEDGEVLLQPFKRPTVGREYWHHPALGPPVLVRASLLTLPCSN
jgi:hypothetical protein